MTRDPESLFQDGLRYAPFEPDLDHYRNLLADAYYDYTETVSPKEMAISLRTAAYILWLCVKVRATSVCDFGSGFTSYVLRLFARASIWPQGSVTSIDDNPEWLQKTSDFLQRRDCDTDGLVLWADDLELPNFDIVVYDFASGAVREQWMGYALAHTKIACVFDDAMHDGHWLEMERAAGMEGMKLCSLQLWTRDYIARYAALAFRDA